MIDRPRRVVFASTETAPDGASFDSEVEATFEERGAGTLVAIVQKGFPSAEIRDAHRVGLPHAFDPSAGPWIRPATLSTATPWTVGRR